jgi:hypothetical protein
MATRRTGRSRRPDVSLPASLAIDFVPPSETHPELRPLSGEGSDYPFPEDEAPPSFRPVSPFRLPPEIELSLWAPVRPIPRRTGTTPRPVLPEPDP